MAAILRMIISNAFLELKNICISITISLQFVPIDLVDNKSALVQIIAWCLTGDMSVFEPMMA